MPTVTSPLNLTKPTVGGDKDVWGQYWNDNADKLNAIHTNDGTGTSVGMHVGTGKVLKIDGGTSESVLPGQLDSQTLRLRDAIDATKIVDFKADLITTLTTRTLKAPDRSGTIALEEQLIERVSAAMPTGTVLHGYWGAVPPTGFVFADGRTIGDDLSGATNRAHATDTEALFTRFWTFNDAVRFPLQNQDGTTATRGASAAVDFDAHKRITLPNHSGRVAAGRDNLSGTAAGILSGYTSVGVVGGTQDDPAQAIAVGGSCSVSVTVSGSIAGNTSVSNSDTRGMNPGGDFADGPQHIHSVSGTFSGNGSGGGSISGSGATAAATNIQPTIVCDVVIAL